MNHLFKSKRILLGLLLLVLLTGTSYLYTPLPNALSQQDYSRIITDNNGMLLGASIADDEQWRFPPVNRLADKYVSALVLFEDKRFYQHMGIDPIAIARAMKLNFEHGRIVSGGSTISMQLARLVLGSNARTYTQKIHEIFLALKLEFKLTKNEILIHYSSLAPFGGNTVGISAANWRYFNIKPSDISWAQAALLAVLPNNPASIHPGRNRKSLLKKRNTLLKKLNEKGLISLIDFKLALLEPLPKKPIPIPTYTRHLLTTLQQKFPLQREFKSHIDLALQKHLITLTDSYNRVYKKNNIHNLSVIVLDNETQQTIAYIGNSTNSDKNIYSQSLDIAQRPRSSGSLFKPFLFAEMIEQGYLLPDSFIEDIPSYYDGYNPKNYDRSYRGLVPAKQALSQSLNVPAVRMLQDYGVSQFKEDLEDFGLTTLWRPAEDYGLSLILGGAETTLWEITNSFSRMVISAKGVRISSNQSQFFEGQKMDRSAYPVSQGASWLTLNSLLEVNRPGIAANWKAFSSSQKIAWKTGTSYGWHDAWAVGSNGKYTVGVWAGNANGEEARQLTGTQTSAPIMFDTFSFLEISDFPYMPLHALKEYDACKVDGYLPSNGCETKTLYAPQGANFSVTSPYYQLHHLDVKSGMRVHGLCEATRNMVSESFFVLPPVHSKYFSDVNVEIKPVPEWRPDCVDNLPLVTNEIPFDIEYPANGTRVKIPVELNGKLGRIVLKAHHRDQKATLYWHLDDRALDSTSYFHEQLIAVNPGWHQLTLVDGNGYKLTRWFKAI